MSAFTTGPPGLPRLLAGLDSSGAPMTLADHERVHGDMPRKSPRELIDAVQRSGLRGRGGADFPTAVKLRSVGCSLGCGVLIALGESACGLHESARVIGYLASQSVGQCGPCVHGLRAIADAFGALADGVASERVRDRVLRWTAEVRGWGACHHPAGAARFADSAPVGSGVPRRAAVAMARRVARG